MLGAFCFPLHQALSQVMGCNSIAPCWFVGEKIKILRGCCIAGQHSKDSTGAQYTWQQLQFLCNRPREEIHEMLCQMGVHILLFSHLSGKCEGPRLISVHCL